MGSAQRMIAIECEVEAPVCALAEAERGKQLSLEREQHREVPVEHVEVEVRAAPHQPVQEADEIGLAVAAAQLHPAMEVPAEEPDAPARAFERRGHPAEVALAVDAERDAFRMRDAPAGAPFFEHGPVPDLRSEGLSGHPRARSKAHATPKPLRHARNAARARVSCTKRLNERAREVPRGAIPLPRGELACRRCPAALRASGSRSGSPARPGRRSHRRCALAPGPRSAGRPARPR